jgi:hypothetical protein
MIPLKGQLAGMDFPDRPTPLALLSLQVLGTAVMHAAAAPSNAHRARAWCERLVRAQPLGSHVVLLPERQQHQAICGLVKSGNVHNNQRSCP